MHAVQKLARVNVVAAQGGQLAHDAAQKGEGDAPLEHGHPRILLRPERGDGVAAGVALLAEGGERLEDAPREGGGGGGGRGLGGPELVWDIRKVSVSLSAAWP